MEVVVPVVAADFIFDSASTTPYVSAPSSPRALGGEWPSSRHFYTSAPSSPTRATAIFRDFSAAMASGLASPRPSSSHRSSVIPFEWEDAPGTPKSLNGEEEEEHAPGQVEVEGDFAFEFSGQLDLGGSSPLTADELFEEGMIRPLKPPPRLQYPPPVARAAAASEKGSALSPRSPRSPKSPKSPRSPRSLFSRWRKQDDFDPFARAIEETTRGRDRANPPGHPAGPARRAARSLSPLRMGPDFGQHGHNSPAAASPVAGAPTGGAAAPTSGPAAAAARWIKGGSKKWRLRDLLLFRSASEGRATGSGARDPLRKYTALSPSSSAMLSRKSSAASISSVGGGGGEDTRNSSFRSTDSGSVGGSSRRGGGGSGGGSAHGRRYAEASRAAAEEMRRRTMLPYRQGLFGCLGFNPAINGLARGFSRTRS